MDSSQVGVALAVVVLAFNVRPTEGSQVVEFELHRFRIGQVVAEEHEWWILGLGIVIGMMSTCVILCACRCATSLAVNRGGSALSLIGEKVAIDVTLNVEAPTPSRSSKIETFSGRRPRNRKGKPVYLTPEGECVHQEELCPTLRNSRKIIRRHLCTQCFQEGERPP